MVKKDTLISKLVKID